MAKLVAKIYGDALFELAIDMNQLDAFYNEAEGVLDALLKNQELTSLMNHPKIMKEEKIKIIENIFKGRVSSELLGFLVVIVTKDRYNEIISILRYFISEVKEYENIGMAAIVTAVELKAAQKKQVMDRLLETTKYVKIEAEYAVDSSLIGGMIIRIGDRVIDSSIKTKIHELSKDLSKIQLA